MYTKQRDRHSVAAQGSTVLTTRMVLPMALSRMNKNLGATLLLLVGMLGVHLSHAIPALAATLPPTTCTLSGTTRTCNLWATTGTLTLPDASTVPIWGYADSAGGSATLPGPMLIVNQGETVVVNLTNNLTVDTALLFPGQPMIPDRVGAAANGGVASYTFVASEPGTYLYEAGMLAGAQNQVAMGLYGALIVRPATANQAYATADSAYDDEALVVLSEIDPNLNSSATPATFDMRTFTPRYYLINGLAYPDTVEIDSLAGNKVLLRYVNAGVKYHSMGLLGLHQTLIAVDGSLQPFGRSVVAETISTGQTVDMIATIPATAAPGAKFPLMDADLKFNNNGAAGFGGMLTFLSIPGTTTGDTVGPTAMGLTLTPSGVDFVLDATIDDTANGGSNVTAAEYYINSTSGTAVAMAGTFGGTTAAVNATISGLLGGETIYVRGQDSAGNWGSFNSIIVPTTDSVGPTTAGLTLAPNPSNRTADIALSATADDTASGNSNVVAAEYFIGTPGANGSGTPMTVNPSSPIAGLDATIPMATVQGLLEGVHVVNVHALDAAGNWGAFVQNNLLVDLTGPDTTGVTIAPNPNNGALGVSPSQPNVRVDANFSDAGGVVASGFGSWNDAASESAAVDNGSGDTQREQGTVESFIPLIISNGQSATDGIVRAAAGPVTANVVAAEGFIDTVGADGTGFPFLPLDGAFDSAIEDGFAFIPLTTINALADGLHTIYVHSQDAAGNWGPIDSDILVIERNAPTLNSIAVSPNPTNGATSVALTGNATDAESAINLGEWFIGTDPGIGNGTPMAATFNGTTYDLSATVDVTGFAVGNHTIVMRARDAAGNWSATQTTVLTVDVPQPDIVYFSTIGSGAIAGVAGPYDDADIYAWDTGASLFSRAVDIRPGTINLAGNADIDGLVYVSATEFYVSFNRNGGVNLPGLGTVQDEDIAYYNGGTWSLFFDGSAQGLDASNGQDIDAFGIDPANNDVYFSTVGNSSIPGVAGPFDDSDIYKWDGAVIERVFDGRDAGLPGNADIDGLVYLAGDQYYISFNRNGGTNVPGLGSVADENIVEFNAGTWSLYFDGTAQGLNSSNGQDVDAIDVE